MEDVHLDVVPVVVGDDQAGDDVGRGHDARRASLNGGQTDVRQLELDHYDGTVPSTCVHILGLQQVNGAPTIGVKKSCMQ